MEEYDILLSHGPVAEVEYMGGDTVVYTLDDGRKFTVRFSIVARDGGKYYRRDIRDGDGNDFFDETEFDVFDGGLTTADYAQWTADNFCEIEELVGFTGDD